jgi:Domain of unknown function (DUF4326)
MAQATLVNIRTCKTFDVSIMRPGPFGNPYRLGSDGDRAEVIRKFRYDFYARLKIDPAWKAKVDSLHGKVLACCCTPLPCHGDIYLEYLNSGPGLPTG